MLHKIEILIRVDLYSYQDLINLKNDKPKEKISAFSGINYPDLSLDRFKNNYNISGDIYKVVPLAYVFANVP